MFLNKHYQRGLGLAICQLGLWVWFFEHEQHGMAMKVKNWPLVALYCCMATGSYKVMEAQQLRFNAVTLEVLCYAEHLAEELHEHAKTLGRMVPILDEPGLGFRFVWEKWSRYAVHVSGGKYGSDFIRGTCRLRNLHPSLPRPNQARSLALAGDDQVTVVMTYANKADWLKIMHMCPQYWRITGWRGPCMVHPWGPAIGGVRRATGPPPLDPRVRDTKERWERHKHWWVDHRCGTSVGRPCAHPRRRRCVVIASVLNKRKYAD